MSKGQKIYVITSGEYSDYHICAVTTDPERAEQLKKKYTHYDETYIEEYIDGDPKAGDCSGLKPIWSVTMNAGKKWMCILKHYTEEDFQNTYRLTDPQYIIDKFSTAFGADICAPDEEHALKIARDKYAKMMAEKLEL